MCNAVLEVNSDSDTRLIKRAEAFRWLADAFWNVPDANLFMRYNSAAFVGFGSYVEELAQKLSSIICEQSETLLEGLAVDYTYLFASGRLDAPSPYESLYTGSHRALMQDARDEVLLFYRQCGYVVPACETYEPEDHLSCELRFLAFLYDQASRATGKEEESQALECAEIFKAEHISKWIELFNGEVQSQSKTVFYQTVGSLTVALNV